MARRRAVMWFVNLESAVRFEVCLWDSRNLSGPEVRLEDARSEDKGPRGGQGKQRARQGARPLHADNKSIGCKVSTSQKQVDDLCAVA